MVIKPPSCPIIFNAPTAHGHTRNKKLRDVRAAKGVAVGLMNSNEACEYNGAFGD